MTLAALVLATLLAVTATAQEQVYDIGKGVTTPVAIKDRPRATDATTMRDKVQGRVGLRAVVLADGRVGDVEVTKALHPDLDAECVKALKQWEFKPGPEKASRSRFASLSR